MDRPITLFTHPWSRGRIARWMLEEIGTPYEVTFVDYGEPMKAAAYRAVNPMGKVPALRHGDTVITETAAICAYLADAFPAAGLAPPTGDPARGPYYRWLFFAAGPLESAVTNHALGVVVPAGKEMLAGYGSFVDVLATLEGELAKREYIAGDQVTAADIYLGAQIGWGMQFGTIEKRPVFERYAARMYARPAAARAAALDDAAAAAHPVPGMPTASES